MCLHTQAIPRVTVPCLPGGTGRKGGEGMFVPVCVCAMAGTQAWEPA